MSIEIRPATAARWADVETVFGIRGEPPRCFCQYFVDPHWTRGAARNREELEEQVRTLDPAPGLVAYVDGEPVGWTQVGTGDRFSRIPGGGPIDESCWYITCFVIKVGNRRQGVATALLDGAVTHARANGARVIRARPTDTSGGTRPGTDLYTGVLSSFLAAGFTEVGRNHSRVVVELRC